MTKKAAKRSKVSRGRGNAVNRTIDWRPRLLDELRRTGNLTLACRLVQVDRRTVWENRNEDEVFAAQYAEALEEAVDLLIEEARRRGVEGVERKQFTRDGDPINDPETKKQYVIREYSDTLLVQLLRAHDPRFRVSRMEHTGKDGGAISLSILDTIVATADADDERARSGG